MSTNAVGSGEAIAGTGNAPNEVAPMLFTKNKKKIAERLRRQINDGSKSERD
jgi:hypothetical protein